ncbi:MAG: protein kinase, partial [archaeon]|nr:protein kinase [archaeon]
LAMILISITTSVPFFQIFFCLYLRGWRETTPLGDRQPLLLNTKKWGKEIMSSKASGVGLQFLLDDRDVVKIPRKAVDIQQQLGAGGFGAVFLGVWRHHKQELQVAIKKTHFAASTSPETLHDFMVEIKFLAQLEHPNILKLLGVVVIEEESDVLMLTEYMSGGNLRDYMIPEVSLTTKSRLLLDVVEGMRFLHAHQPPITHRDLKLENVLISSEGVAKIADFGLTVVQDHTMTQTIFGSIHIIAPEIFLKQKYDERIDVYSFGIMAAELFTGNSFHHQLRSTVEWDFAMIEKILAGERPILDPALVPEPLRNLLEECWASDPTKRPPFVEIAPRLRRIHQSCPQSSSS